MSLLDTLNALKTLNVKTHETEINNLGIFVGKHITDITHLEEELIFLFDDGSFLHMYHDQECCEHVYIESIVGNFQDLLHNPLLIAEVVSNNDEEASESGTWTFYKFATIKGYVDIRWYGCSNGHYSEDVTTTLIEVIKQ